MQTVTGRVVGTWDYGACGIVPLIEVPITKPKFRNNGFNCYSGMPVVRCPELFDLLPADGHWKEFRQGHVMVRFTDGERFGTYASGTSAKTDYSFS